MSDRKKRKSAPITFEEICDFVEATEGCYPSVSLGNQAHVIVGMKATLHEYIKDHFQKTDNLPIGKHEVAFPTGGNFTLGEFTPHGSWYLCEVEFPDRERNPESDPYSE